MAKSKTGHPAQDTVDISYEDREGNKYSEVHGDPEKNLEVESVAEQKGELQPNLEGTTPDPKDPELTDWEKERRGLVEKATKPSGDKQATTTHNKQAQRAEDK